MDADRIAKWIGDVQGWIDPPGCECSFLPLPGSNNGCCVVGTVWEHRFAFFFWGLYHSAKDTPSPVLVSIDAHDDVGVPSEVVPEDLDNLDIQNRTELGLFAWLRLRSLNDGHILPALYLNFFSDVYVLLNGHEEAAAFQTARTKQLQVDCCGYKHIVRFYRDPEKLLSDLPETGPVFVDLDLDYFSIDNPSAGSVLGSENILPDEEIRSFLSLDGPIFERIWNRIVGMTLALEPEYCGGLANSLHILDIVNQELFDGTLCTHDCRWKRH